MIIESIIHMDIMRRKKNIGGIRIPIGTINIGRGGIIIIRRAMGKRGIRLGGIIGTIQTGITKSNIHIKKITMTKTTTLTINITSKTGILTPLSLPKINTNPITGEKTPGIKHIGTITGKTTFKISIRQGLTKTTPITLVEPFRTQTIDQVIINKIIIIIQKGNNLLIILKSPEKSNLNL